MLDPLAAYLFAAHEESLAPEEIAAVLAVVAARSGGGSDPVEDDTQAQTWSAHGHAHRHIRAVFAPSRHGWKTSFWPR